MGHAVARYSASASARVFMQFPRRSFFFRTSHWWSRTIFLERTLFFRVVYLSVKFSFYLKRIFLINNATNQSTSASSISFSLYFFNCTFFHIAISYKFQFSFLLHVKKYTLYKYMQYILIYFSIIYLRSFLNLSLRKFSFFQVFLKCTFKNAFQRVPFKITFLALVPPLLSRRIGMSFVLQRRFYLLLVFAALLRPTARGNGLWSRDRTMCPRCREKYWMGSPDTKHNRVYTTGSYRL